MSLLSRLAVQAARAYGILSSNPNNVSASYLVVAGGGSGGGAVGGGGGAGGLLTSTFTLSTLNTYTIAVGAGGASVSGSTTGNNGANSSISGTGLSTVTATGGGYGGNGNYTPYVGANGGSGGGGGGKSTSQSGGTGTSGQGNNGGIGYGGTSSSYTGGGGGGAGASGTDGGVSNYTGGNGGNGTASSISGSSVTYAGGGGGCGLKDSSGGPSPISGTGGTGGGGTGAADPRFSSATAATSGTANTGGGGGGGAYYSNGASGSGGSGIVIISYPSATPLFVGGTLTTSGGNQIHTFTSSGTLSPLTPVTASYLVVAGGGGGGSNSGGGAGAGGLQASSTTLYSGATYVVTVGAGGAGGASGGNNTGSNGSDSVVSGTGLTTLTSTGGGGGGKNAASPNGSNGGSGGGGGSNGATLGTGGTGVSGQGYAGGTGATDNATYRNGGGGGGASAVGSNGTSSAGGAGGNGSASSISGSSVTYAGGGGGASFTTGGAGGTGGGGAGTGGTGGAAGGSGTTNLGGGGGGGAGGNGAGGSGGSGIVIISYAGSQVFNGGLVTSSGGNTIHTFTATGALTPLTNNLNNSLRFRSSASASLSRTPTVVGNRQKWTWSAWIKKGTLSSGALYFNGGTVGSNTYTNILDNGQTLGLNVAISGSGLVISCKTAAVFRDPSAWYHFVVSVDTTQATNANGIKIYVNGNQQTLTFTAYTQNTNTQINNTVTQDIGQLNGYASELFDGYMADVILVDGQQLEPYYFGNNDANGVWKPIQYKGTYGTNGFYLTFGNTTSTTTLGYDSSPNGNNWTCNNISLTSGTTYDAMTDVPTNTSATVANYAVWSPLVGSVGVTLSQANLSATFDSASGTRYGAIGTIGVSSGKWYWEYEFSAGGNSALLGITQKPFAVQMGTWPGEQTGDYGYYGSNGNKYTAGSGSSYGATFTTGDVIGVALDLDAGTLTFYKNNTSQGTAFSSISGTFFPAIGKGITATGITSFINFGQRPFSYTPPTGFVALNTYNLPTPTILQGNKYMDATLYTGTGTSQVTVNAGQFKPDFVWIKSRSNAYNNELYDSVRGVQKRLVSNLTNAESTSTNGLTAFNSNGFTQGGEYETGLSGNYVGWQWQAGQGSTSSNTSGSITSTVSVNTTAGFSIVTYTGNGSNGASFGHGLGVSPAMVIFKNRTNGSVVWVVHHQSFSDTAKDYLVLNATDAKAQTATNWFAKSSSIITLTNAYAGTNASSENFVAYCWAAIAGYSAFGSYTGNGSSDGVFVYTGFLPRFVMIKNYSSGGSWVIHDTARDTYNVTNKTLYPNYSNAESTPDAPFDVLSNGFKLRSSTLNDSGAGFIYAAFASNPFKNSNSF